MGVLFSSIFFCFVGAQVVYSSSLSVTPEPIVASRKPLAQQTVPLELSTVMSVAAALLIYQLAVFKSHKEDALYIF